MRNNRTLVIVLAVVGLGGTCALGSCLLLGALGLSADPPGSNATSPAPAEAEAPSSVAASAGDHPYLCMATAMVRICRGPNLCSSHYATGSGVGATVEESKQMAMTACRGQVVAMQGYEPCTVTCSQKK